MSYAAFARAPGLLVNLDCNAFKMTRRNPDGTFKPSADQQEALDKLTALLTHRAPGKRTVLVLTGYAGTGKTTVMKLLMERLEKAGQKVVLLAPTGKAAARLKESTKRETGTVHSFIYSHPTQMGICPVCGEKSEALGQSGVVLKREKQKGWTCPFCSTFIPLDREQTIDRELGFAPKKQDKDDAAVPSVVIVDEASMVDEKLANDIESYLPPNYAVLYVGDKGQLPPVGGRWGAKLDQPDAALTKVHRQSSDNPILNLATRIREGKNEKHPFALDPNVDPGNRLILVSGSLQEAAAWLAKQRENKADATLLAYTNKTRQALNTMVREFRGLTKVSRQEKRGFVHADRALILSNNREAGLTNGEVVIVEESWFPKGKLRDEGFIWVKFWKRGTLLVRQDLIGADYATWRDEMKPYTSDYTAAERALASVEAGYDSGLTPAEEEEAEDLLSLDPEERFDVYGAIAPRDLIHADYGECITVHKSQGSQWRIVGLIWDYPTQRLFRDGSQKDPLEGVRWLYTAVTRASEYLRVFKV